MDFPCRFLCAILYVHIAVVHGLYEWACTDPDTSGQWYIPSERDTSAGDVRTNGELVTIYRVGNLTDTDCYGEVTAIEFCYRYTLPEDGVADEQVYFNWTVLILGDIGQGSFVINNIYTIESRPSLLDSASCTDEGATRRCCDVQQISSFTLPINFIFAFTESAQGNTNDAELLGFPDALPQYRVNNVVQILKLDLNTESLSVGSTLPRRQTLQRAIRMLWFVIASGPDPPTGNTTTKADTTVPITSMTSAMSMTTKMTTMAVAGNTSEASTTTRTSDSCSNMAMQSSSTLIGAVLGTVVALLMLLVLILVLSLVWCVRKASRDKQAYDIRQPIEIGQINDPENQAEMPQRVDVHDTNAAVEMKTNAAYISSPTALQITTEENVAYAGTIKTGCDYERVDYDYVI